MPRDIEAFKIYQAEWRRTERQKNPEKVRARGRADYQKNREVILERVKRYQEENSVKIAERRVTKYKSHEYSYRRDKSLMKLYGITHADYEKMYETQSGLCAICETFHPILSIDHCHDTNVVRGLLCNKCNLALGLLNDSVENFENAAGYLSAHKNDPRTPMISPKSGC